MPEPLCVMILSMCILALFLFSSIASDIKITSKNGKTTVIWNGNVVFKGVTSGAVTAQSIKTDAGEVAAAFDNDTVIWESEPGAAEKIRTGQVKIERIEIKQDTQIKKETQNNKTSINTTTVNGETTVVYNGKVVYRGATHGKITTKKKTVDGEEYAAVFDDNNVIWENIPGAAEKLK